MNDLSYLSAAAEQEAPATGDSLKQLRDLADRYKLAKTLVAEKKQELKDAEKTFNKLSQELIPDKMQEIGMETFTMSTGETISCKPDVSVSIKDPEAFFKFLKDRDDDAIIKTTLEMGKIPKEILSMIIKDLAEKYEVFVDAKQTVHPQTLAAYVRRLCGIGTQTEAQMALAEIDQEMLKTFEFFKTVIK